MTRPSGATWSSMSSVRPTKQRFSTSKTLPRRLEFVSSGQNSRKFADSALRDVDVAQQLAELAGGLPPHDGGPLDLDGVVAEVGDVEVDQQPAAVGVRVGAHAAVALRREGGQLGHQLAVVVEQRLGLVASASTPRAAPAARGRCACRPSAPGGRGRCPRPDVRRPPWGPSSPSACAARWPASAAAR